MAVTGPIGHNHNSWVLKRALWFHHCRDTKKLIWPLSNAHHMNIVWVQEAAGKITYKSPWITQQAYTFRLITGNMA